MQLSGTMDPEDNWMIHAADTLREGEFLADYERVEVLCKNAPDAVNELVNWGARFHREKDGRLTQRFFGAHTYRRTVFYEDWTGEEIIRVLMEQVSQRKIEIIDNVYVIKLLKSDDVIGEGPAEKKEGRTRRSQRSTWHRYRKKRNCNIRMQVFNTCCWWLYASVCSQ